MLRRRHLALTAAVTFAGAVAFAGAALTGCAPAATPTPTPTPHFTSEAQAFKAAEATYRAYVDAYNKVDIRNPATFEGAYNWQTGDALGVEKKSLTQMHADGWILGGVTEPGTIDPNTYAPTGDPVISIHACMDVRAVTVTDAAGKSLVRADRPDLQPLVISFKVADRSPTGLLISSMAGGDFTCTG